MRTIDEIEARVNFFVRTNVIAKVGAFLTSVFPKLSPNNLTLLGIVLAFLASLFIVWLGLIVGAFAVLLSSLPDAFDGEVARAKNRSTSFGAFLDDNCDRLEEIMVFSAILWLQDNRIDFLVVSLAGMSSILTSYSIATARARGFNPSTGKVTGRPGRIILLVILMLISLWFPVAKTLWLLIFLNAYTITKRWLEVKKQNLA